MQQGSVSVSSAPWISHARSLLVAEMDSNTAGKVADAAMNLVQAVTSGVEQSQLNLQNTTNQHLADVKVTLGILQRDSSGKALLGEVEELKKENKALREEVKAIRDALQKTDKARRIEFALQNHSLADDFKYYCISVTTQYNQRNWSATECRARNLVRKHFIRVP